MRRSGRAPDRQAAAQVAALQDAVAHADDVIDGTPRRDVICGLGGDDVLRGLAGNDVLRGGPGDDRLVGARAGTR